MATIRTALTILLLSLPAAAAHAEPAGPAGWLGRPVGPPAVAPSPIPAPPPGSTSPPRDGPLVGLVDRGAPAAPGPQVWSLAFSPDGAQLAGVTEDGWVWVDRVANRSRTLARNLKAGPLHVVAWTPDGATLLVGCGDGTVRSLAPALARDEAPPRVLGEPQDRQDASLWGLAASPDATRVVSTGDDGTFRVWNLRTGELEQASRSHEQSIHAPPCFVAGSRSVVVGGNDGLLVVEDLETRKPAIQMPVGGRGIRSLAVPRPAIPASPAATLDVAWIATGCYDAKVRLWDLRSTRIPRLLEGPAVEANALAFTPDGRYLFGGIDDGSIFAWEVASGRVVVRSERAHQGWISALAISPDGATLASAGQGSALHLWSLAYGSAPQGAGSRR